ncbi:unnamed protein product, partial [Caenorhabditis brenneri]
QRIQVVNPSTEAETLTSEQTPMIGISRNQSPSSATLGVDGTSSNSNTQRSSPVDPSSQEKLHKVIQSMTEHISNRSSTPIQAVGDDDDNMSTVSSADTLHNLTETTQQLLHINRDTLAMVVDLPKGQAVISDTLSKVEEHVCRIKRRSGHMEQSLEQIAHSTRDIRRSVDAFLDRARLPQKIDQLSVTSTTIWHRNALKGARSIVDVMFEDKHIIAQYDKVGQHARLFRYGYLTQVEYPRQFELIRDQMDRYARGYPLDARVATQEASWEEFYIRPSENPSVFHECQCIPEMVSDEDSHEDPLSCAARRYAQNLLLEIRVQLQTTPLSSIKLIKLEDINLF